MRKTGIWSRPTVYEAVAQRELSVAVTVSADDKEPIEPVKPSFTGSRRPAPRRAVEKQIKEERQ